jgi:hypothetical protein
MFTTFDKAWIPALLSLGSAVVLGMTGAGEGPTADQIGQIGTLGSAAIVAGIQAVLVYLIPNKPAA